MIGATQNISMYSWKALSRFPLKRAGEISTAFIGLGIRDWRSAAEMVNRLPYGRNASPSDKIAVLRERRGTCSTKHALLRRLAIEQDLEIELVMGIYLMSGRNTPGVGDVLVRYGLKALPEAHCYLRSGKRRIDVTRVMEPHPVESIAQFLHEEAISPDQIGEYKVNVHRRFLQPWMASLDPKIPYTLDEIWDIREECIAALIQSHSAAVI
jgi:hypothetical protein